MVGGVQAGHLRLSRSFRVLDSIRMVTLDWSADEVVVPSQLSNRVHRLAPDLAPETRAQRHAPFWAAGARSRGR